MSTDMDSTKRREAFLHKSGEELWLCVMEDGTVKPIDGPILLPREWREARLDASSPEGLAGHRFTDPTSGREVDTRGMSFAPSPQPSPQPEPGVAALREALTDEQIDDLLDGLSIAAERWEAFSYGLPTDAEPVGWMREVVRQWLLDKTLAASPSTQASLLQGQGKDAEPVALRDIAAERKRQIEQELWTPEHDDEHTGRDLAKAAACYALDDSRNWPWSWSWWKPKDDRSNLVKAGALIIAEIERLDRAALGQQKGQP